jgi:hypothetical protein
MFTCCKLGLVQLERYLELQADATPWSVKAPLLADLLLLLLARASGIAEDFSYRTLKRNGAHGVAYMGCCCADACLLLLLGLSDSSKALMLLEGQPAASEHVAVC